MAKNASPAASVRLSIEIPGTDCGNAPSRSAPIAAAMASTVHNTRAVMRQAP
jgi:hypothetical protein